jgi:tryptophan-rich sensory protein
MCLAMLELIALWVSIADLLTVRMNQLNPAIALAED